MESASGLFECCFLIGFELDKDFTTAFMDGRAYEVFIVVEGVAREGFAFEGTFRQGRDEFVGEPLLLSVAGGGGLCHRAAVARIDQRNEGRKVVADDFAIDRQQRG